MRRAERLFRLVNELRQRGTVRAQDLAAHLDVSVRTVYRDIAHRQASGLPLEGEAGVGYLLRPGFQLPALTFTAEQLDALALGLCFAEVAGDTSLAEAAREVRVKLQASLPDPGKRSLDAIPLFAFRGDDQAADAAKAIRSAIRNRRVLRIDYDDGHGVRTSRRVNPLAIWIFADASVCAAWCELRHAFRVFRLDRICAVRETGERFELHPDRSLQAFVAAKDLGGTRTVTRVIDAIGYGSAP